MKVLLKITAICLLILINTISLAVLDKSDNGKLNVIVQGLASDNGTVMIALFNSRSSYEAEGDENNAFIKVSTDFSNRSSEYLFTDIPYGDYAIKLFHDKNGNSKLDKNLFGAPNEPHGFSNNSREKRSQPAWESAMFKVDAENVIQKIEVR